MMGLGKLKYVEAQRSFGAVQSLTRSKVSQGCEASMCFVASNRWPRGLRRGSTIARLLRLCARIPPGAVCCEQARIYARVPGARARAQGGKFSGATY